MHKIMLIIRFGDQMNNVAVTDGDKVSAEQVFKSPRRLLSGKRPDEVLQCSGRQRWELMILTSKNMTMLLNWRKSRTEAYTKVWNSAKAEIALVVSRKIQVPKHLLPTSTTSVTLTRFGLASQRLMEEGYGFGAEGDWKTAALYRTTWFMSQGMPKGCSFLEDYTLHFDGEKERYPPGSHAGSLSADC